jgi:hypothetical protein
VVTTLAGSTQGYADGNGIAALFYEPRGVCSDALGYIYVTDKYNNKIRKITPTGLVTTLASSNVNNPDGICIDISGNLYVTETDYALLKKITPSGIVTTIAGSSSGGGYVDGTGDNAKFFNPSGLCMDTSGNVFIADAGNNRIRKMIICDASNSPIVNITTSNSFICAGQSVTLSASGGGSYLWSNGSLLNSITISPSSTTTYTVTATNTYGCSTIASKTVIVNSLPVISITNSLPIICSGQNVTLTASGASTYTWNNGTIGSTVVVNPSINTTYTVTGTDTNGCTATANKIVNVFSTPSTSISADGFIATSTTITNGSSVQLQLNGTLNAQPNIQWTPATAISSATVSNPVVYPSATTTYNASFTNTNGCLQSTTFQVIVTPQPTIGNLSITSSNNTIGLFDTITVNVQVTNAANLYSLYMKLKGNTAVSQYLNYSGHTASGLLGSGSNVISTPPTVINGVPDFGITKVGAVPGYTGSGLFYSFRFVTKDITIPAGTTFCFYLDDVSANNSSGIPCGLNNQGQYCYAFTNQVNVWPGDLNKSNSVSTADILPIGYFYNSTGSTRTNANIQWTPQPATLWGYNHSSPNSNAYKVFADSNGDGVINNADQAAIGFNMNQVHARHASTKPFSIAPKIHHNTLTVGDLIVTPNNTVINAANLPQTVTFTVNLNNTGGLNALYGISVNLIFDDTIFDLNTASIDYTGSIFGTAGSDCLVMNYNSATGVSVGLTRYANAAINGQGLLFKVTLQTIATLSSLTQTTVTAYVDAANNQTGDSLVIQDAPVTNLTITNNLGFNDVNKDDFLLYPNPANDILYLTTGRNIDQINSLKLIVFNTLGQIVNEIPIRSSNMQISTRNWGASGVYFVKIVADSNNIVSTKKVILK